MIINAYKPEMVEDLKTEQKSELAQDDIVKAIVQDLIKGEKNAIEEMKIEIIKSIIDKKLLNDYHITIDGQMQKIKQEILDRIYGYGIIQKHIDNIDVTDIRIVAYDNIYIKEKGKWKKVSDKFKNNKELEEYIRFCALKNNSTINFERPIVIFSDRKNSLRLEAGLEPANVLSPSLVIRIHRKNNNIDMQNLFVKYGMLDKDSYKILQNKIHTDDNIILCGKGGSGKTTLLKAIIKKVPSEVSITSNEETAELYLSGRNIIQRECILNRQEDKNIDLEKLSRHSLVMSNDMIIIGELKGAEANAFFDSISTGHVGLATVHADSSKNAIDRIITLIKKDIKAQYYTENFLRRFLASSIDYIVFLNGFKVEEIAKVNFNEETLKLELNYLYNIKR